MVLPGEHGEGPSKHELRADQLRYSQYRGILDGKSGRIAYKIVPKDSDAAPIYINNGIPTGFTGNEEYDVVELNDDEIRERMQELSDKHAMYAGATAVRGLELETS